MTTQRSRCARIVSSLTSRVLPMPASPPRMTTPPSPRRAASSASSSADSSASRPMSLGMRTRASAIRPSVPLSRLRGFPLRCLRLAQATAEGLHQPVGDFRVIAKERLEAPLGDSGENEVGRGGDTGAPALVIEQRHLAEVIPRTELAVTAVGGLDLGLAFEDKQEADASVAADHDLCAFGVLDLSHLLGDLLELGRREAVKDADGLEVHPRDSTSRTGLSTGGGSAWGRGGRGGGARA